LNKRILIIGKNSFVGKSFYHSVKSVDIISYYDIDKTDFSNYNVVLNCAITPEFKFESYREKHDLDFQVAKISAYNNCHYIMMSTRKVYGTSNELRLLNENSKLNPFDYYSENKAISEKNIMRLGESFTILRVSNAYGFEYGRNSFMGFCMTQLKHDNKIVYTTNPNAKKDFISIDSLCEVLGIISKVTPKGIYNVGSNYGSKIGDVAKSLIQGYGQGEFIYNNIGNKNQDQFILDNTKLCRDLGIQLPTFQKKYIKKLGEKL
jgi:nucleoside-diphosphate-sugar epimerase